jgi:hypothetical protein
MRVVKIWWKDQFHQNPGAWVAKKDVSEFGKRAKAVSVGFLVLEDDDQYVISHTYEPYGKEMTGVFHISKASVYKIEEL